MDKKDGATELSPDTRSWRPSNPQSVVVVVVVVVVVSQPSTNAKRQNRPEASFIELAKLAAATKGKVAPLWAASFASLAATFPTRCKTV